MSVPRVLLLSPQLPGDVFTGRVYLRDLCLRYPPGNLCCFCVPPVAGQSLPRELSWIPVAYGRYPRERGFRALGDRFMKASCLPVVLHTRWVRVPALVGQAVAFGRRQQVNLLWAVLETHAVTLMAKQVAARLGVPLVSTVWDPPYGDWALRAEYDPWSRRLLRHDFVEALRASLRCGVASETMRSEFRSRYGVESLVMIHGVRPSMQRAPAVAADGRREFVIGFAGNLYALDAWSALLAALSRADWCIEGRPVLIRVLGWRAPLEARGRVRIEYLGWRSTEETVQLLSETDVAYLPYWFDPWHAEDVRLCFPGKLSTYLAAGRPVLYHGPRESSPARFFERFPVGLCCHSLDAAEILDTLRRFIEDRNITRRAAAATQEALAGELDPRAFIRRFAALIGVAEEALVPVE